MQDAARLSVGILGLGQIAQGYDEPAGPSVTTHIKACLLDARLNVDWIADLDPARAEAVRTKWGLNAGIVSPQALVAKQPDILCIASPDDTHAGWVRAALLTPPRLILCEKPLAQTFAEARDLIDSCANAGVPLVVNFMRRWLPGVAEWISAARVGAYGAPVGVDLTYYRGLRHNACHWFDIVGSAIGAECLSVKDVCADIYDFSASDPTVSATMEVRVPDGIVPVRINGVDRQVSDRFSLDMRFADGRLRIWNEGGIRVQTAGPGAHTPREFIDSPPRYMTPVWRNLADHLTEGRALRYMAKDGLDGVKLVEAVVQKVFPNRAGF